MRANSLALWTLLAIVQVGCRGQSEKEAAATAAINRYGCGSCHTIGTIRNARGLVGPPLTGIGSRMYVAGMLNNNHGNMVTWIRNPKAVNPATAMPNLGVTETDARTIAAFLEEQ